MEPQAKQAPIRFSSVHGVEVTIVPFFGPNDQGLNGLDLAFPTGGTLSGCLERGLANNGLLAGQYVPNHKEPGEQAVDDRPQDRLVEAPRNGDRERGAKTHAIAGDVCLDRSLMRVQ